MRLEDEYNMEATPDANVEQMVGRTADEAVPAVTEAAASAVDAPLLCWDIASAISRMGNTDQMKRVESSVREDFIKLYPCHP